MLTGADDSCRAGHLGAEAQRDAFVRLDAHGDDVGLDPASPLLGGLEESSGGCLNWMLISVTRLARRLPARM
jgi:hypothetical protein